MSISSVHSQKPASRHDQLVTQTEKWVSQTFFGTLLKQMRENPFKSDLFTGGQGGQAFGALYDQQLADRMAVPSRACAGLEGDQAAGSVRRCLAPNRG